MRYKNRKGRMLDLFEFVPVVPDAAVITEFAEALDTEDERDACLMGAYLAWNLLSELIENVSVGDVE